MMNKRIALALAGIALLLCSCSGDALCDMDYAIDQDENSWVFTISCGTIEK